MSLLSLSYPKIQVVPSRNDFFWIMSLIFNKTEQMHKIGIMMMGKMTDSPPKKVKEIILEVEGKTKMSNIAEYLVEMGKSKNTNVQFSLEKNGRPVSDSSNITQTLKYCKPVNGVIKLYLYEKGQFLNVTNDHLRQQREKRKQEDKYKQQQHKPVIQPVEQPQSSGFCCC